MRYRETDLSTIAEYPTRKRWNPAGTLTENVTYPLQSKVGYISNITDEPHPRFFDDMSRGRIVLGDLRRYIWTRSSSPGRVYGSHPEDNWGSIEFTGNLIALIEGAVPWSSHVSESDIEGLASIAFVQAVARAKGSAISGGESLAEFGETLRMLRSPQRAILEVGGRMLDFVRRRNPRNARAVAQAKADAWLQYRYGMLPAVRDAQTLIEQAHILRCEIGKQRRVARAGSVHELQKQAQFTRAQFLVGPSGLYATGRWTVDDKIRASAGIIYELDARKISDNISAFFGLRASDLPVTAWNLIPFSFVADWSLNVGDWLTAITPQPGFHTLGSWTTTVHDRTRTYDPGVAEYKYNSKYDAGYYGGSLTKETTIIRVKTPQLPQWPSFTGIHLSMNQQIDSAALLMKPVMALFRKLR